MARASAAWLLAAWVPALAGEAEPSPPKAASDTVRSAFPGAAIEEVRREVLLGLTFFEVAVKSGAERIEVALSESGAIAEARSPAAFQALPKAVIDSVARTAPGAQILKAQRIDSLAEVRLTRLDKPRITYELVMVSGEQRGKVVLSEDGKVLQTVRWRNPAAPEDEEEGVEGDERLLPKRAADAIRAIRPRATIREVDLREQLGLALYDTEAHGDFGEGHVKVTEDGLLVEIDTDLAAAQVPKAVAEAAGRAAPGADIGGGRRLESLAEARLVPLPAPQVRFRITIAKDGKAGKIEIRPDGAIVAAIRWRPPGPARRP